MSQEDLQKFLEAVRQDPSLQEKLQAEGADPVAIAREAGFSVTQAEVTRFANLSDEDLEDAAGGNGWERRTHNQVEGYGCDVACTRNTSTLGYRPV
jgi:predicted ribosomally synthesized peptide with nif11-like leader